MTERMPTFSLCKISIALMQNLRQQLDSSGSSVRLGARQTKSTIEKKNVDGNENGILEKHL